MPRFVEMDGSIPASTSSCGSKKHCVEQHHCKHIKTSLHALRLVGQRFWQGFIVSVSWVQASACTSVTPAMSYLFIRLAGCSVDPEINRDACKLARTPQVIKIKKRAFIATYFAIKRIILFVHVPILFIYKIWKTLSIYIYIYIYILISIS